MADIEATDPDDYVVVDADGAVKEEVDGKKSAAEESGPNGDSNAADNADAGDALAAAVDKSMTLTDGAASGDATAPPPPSAPRPSNDNVGADMCVRSLAWETTEESLIGTSPPPDSVFPRPRPSRATARETPARDRPLARPRRQRRVLLLSFAPFGQSDRAVAIPGETRHTRFRR